MSNHVFRRELDIRAKRLDRIIHLVNNKDMDPQAALFLYPELAEVLEASGLFESMNFSITDRSIQGFPVEG